METLLCKNEQLDGQILLVEENTVLTNTTEEIVNPSRIKKEKLHNLKSKEISKEEKFKCDICHKTFTQFVRFKLHKEKHQNGEIQMKCNICGKRFEWSIALEEHLLNHSSYSKCNICDKFFDKSDLIDHKQTHKTKAKNKFKCELCGIHCVKIRKHKRKIHNDFNI